MQGCRRNSHILANNNDLGSVLLTLSQSAVDGGESARRTRHCLPLSIALILSLSTVDTYAFSNDYGGEGKIGPVEIQSRQKGDR
jgi:hypothetical protein